MWIYLENVVALFRYLRRGELGTVLILGFVTVLRLALETLLMLGFETVLLWEFGAVLGVETVLTQLQTVLQLSFRKKSSQIVLGRNRRILNIRIKYLKV